MNKLKVALANATTSVGNTVFVAIDGWGASGKTTLASLIGDTLGAEVIRIDDFSRQESFSWIPRLREEVLKPIMNGARALTYQPETWWGHTPDPIVDQPVTPTMVVEGVGCLTSEMLPLWGVTILVDTPRSTCFDRGVERDLASGESKDEITRRWQQWQAAEAQYFEANDLADHVDFVVDGTIPFAQQL